MAKRRITAKHVQANEDKPFVMPTVDVKPDIDTDAFGDDGLTVRQRAFVEALVGPAGGNASRAAEMAGYAAENRNALAVTASWLLRNPKVQQAIAHATAARNLTPDWAKRQLVDIANADMSNFISVDEDGKSYLDMGKAALNGALGQIKEYAEDVIDGDDQRPTVIKRKIKIHDRMQAIGLLLKFHGLIKEGNEPEIEKKQVRVRRVKKSDDS